MKAWDWIQNFFMPEALDEQIVEVNSSDLKEAEEKKSVRAAKPRTGVIAEQAETVQVANGGYETTTTAASSGTARVASARLQMPNVVRIRNAKQTAVQQPQQQPAPQELRINVFAPQSFEDVRAIADDIRGQKAAIVNYDKVDDVMQRRICDFMNGACYVLDGEVRRISSNMVLYVPSGVSIGDMYSVAPIALD